MHYPLPSYLAHDRVAITLVMLFGMVAVYALLPRPQRVSPFLGALAAAGAFCFAGLTFLRFRGISAEIVLFYVFAASAIGSGGLLITQRNPVYAALSFALVVLSTCGLFLLQAAPFLTAATTIVYAGAIVVTFLFVIMLAQQAGRSDADHRSREPFLSSFAGFVLLGALIFVLQQNYDSRVTLPSPDKPGLVVKVPVEDLLDPLLERIGQAQQMNTLQEMEVALGDEMFLDDFYRLADHLERVLRRGKDAQTLSQKIRDLHMPWDDWKRTNDVKAAKHALAELERTAAVLLRDRIGSLQPRESRKLSGFSGVPANQPFEEVPRNAGGWPRLPAENTAHLGQTLFTDYLLAVELAGTLLLVAAIGTIAIATRRTEGLR